jgi:hypothetical protein
MMRVFNYLERALNKRRWTIWLTLAIVFSAGIDVWADLAPAGFAVDAEVFTSVSDAGTVLPTGDHRAITFGRVYEGMELAFGPQMPVLPGGLAASSSDDVKQLPPMPGSATLFLYSLSGFGMYRLGCSARKLNFGNLPEWYQGSGPRQIGYAFAVEVDLTTVALPMLAVFDQPIPDPPLICSSREESPRLAFQYFLTEVDAHAPPF